MLLGSIKICYTINCEKNNVYKKTHFFLITRHFVSYQLIYNPQFTFNPIRQMLISHWLIFLSLHCYISKPTLFKKIIKIPLNTIIVATPAHQLPLSFSSSTICYLGISFIFVSMSAVYLPHLHYNYLVLINSYNDLLHNIIKNGNFNIY